ncbi:MAG: hypothetical protein ACRDVL_02240 [Acidimicrobiia bacterium]
MYDHARHLHEDRIRAAERSRLINELRAARREAGARRTARPADQWQVLWPSTDITGRAVTMVNTATGERHTGRDPADWDRALGEVVRQLGVGV